MKKLSLLLLTLGLLVSLGTIHAQNQRMLIFECFTNTGCGPCAMFNPALDELIENNPDRVAAIKYHVSWPSGNDPMYLHNQADNQARTSFYGVNGVPTAHVDGTTYSGSPSGINQSKINTWSAVESPLELRLTHKLNATQDTVNVVVMGKASTAIESQKLKVFVGIIEKEIHFNSAPGSNGEKDFYSVMKKLLPSANGQSIPSLDAGEYFACSFSWAVANFYDINQLSAIAWVQDYDTKVVYQACKSSENLTLFYSNEAAVGNFVHGKSYVCSGEMEPSVTLTNYGTNTITEATIEILVNEQIVKTLNWSGNLPSLQSELIELGTVEFDYAEENVMTVKLTHVNGGEDEYEGNNTASFEFSGAAEVVGKTFSLTIRTDKDPEETTWELRRSSNGEVVLSGGPYDEPNHTYKQDFQLQDDDCYEFTIYDAGNNGLMNSSGLYGLKAGSTTLFFGKEFADKETNEFLYENSVSVGENPSNNEVNIFPNPTQGKVTIEVTGKSAVSFFNVTGQLVKQSLVEGCEEIDLSNLGKGLYLIIVESSNGEKVRRNIVLQ